MPAAPRLTVLMPVYNEAATVAEAIRRVRAIDVRPLELIVIDDGSTDATASEIQSVRGLVDVVLTLERNRGKGAAVRAGLARARGAVVVIHDADLETDPAELPPLLAEIEAGRALAVYGSRVLGRSVGRHPLFYAGGRLVTAVANLLFRTGLTDAPTCAKMVRRDVLQALDLRGERFDLCFEITAKLARRGVRIVELPISYRPRSVRAGKKLRYRDGLRAVWTLLRWRFR